MKHKSGLALRFLALISVFSLFVLQPQQTNAIHECGNRSDYPPFLVHEYDICVANSTHDDAFSPPDPDEIDPDIKPEDINFDGDYCKKASCQLPAVSTNIEDNEIYEWLTRFLTFLGMGVGIVATVSLVVAGIQYASSRGDPGKTKKAVERVVQVGIAIFLYVFSYAFLYWLIPGGVF